MSVPGPARAVPSLRTRIAGRGLDTCRDTRAARQGEARDRAGSRARHGERRRDRRRRAEREVEREVALEAGGPAEVVGRGDDERPRAFLLRRSVRAAGIPLERVRAGSSRGLRVHAQRAVRAAKLDRDGRRPDDLVAERLGLGDAVAVRRHGRRGRRRGVGAGVLDEQRVGDRLLAAAGGRAQQVSVEGHAARRAAGERSAVDDAEPDERLRELEVRQARAGKPAVDRDEDDAAVRALPDGGARLAQGEVGDRDRLARLDHRLAVPDEERPAADRRGDAGRRPIREQREANANRLAHGRLGAQGRGCRPAGDEHGTVGWDRDRTAGHDLGRCADEVRVRRSGRKRAQDDRDAVPGGGRGRPPGGRVERRARSHRRLVQVRERVARLGALPVAVERDPVEVEPARRVDADARPRGARIVVEDTVPLEQPVRPAAARDDVPVHARGRGGAGEALLDRRQLLRSLDQLVREHRLERPQAARLRRNEDVDADEAMDREDGLLLEGQGGRAGDQLDGLRTRGRSERSRQKQRDEDDPPRHDPRARVAEATGSMPG